MEVKNDKEDLGLILLCSLPPSYITLMDTILYSHDTLTLEDVYDACYSKNKMKDIVSGLEVQKEGFIIRGRRHEKNLDGNSRGRLKSSNSSNDHTCNYCKKKR